MKLHLLSWQTIIARISAVSSSRKLTRETSLGSLRLRLKETAEMQPTEIEDSKSL